jgi:hypothetical protein
VVICILNARFTNIQLHNYVLLNVFSHVIYIIILHFDMYLKVHVNLYTIFLPINWTEEMYSDNTVWVCHIERRLYISRYGHIINLQSRPIQT